MKELTCIGCPLGCALRVELRGEEIDVRGNGCKRGVQYAQSEARRPMRALSSTVALRGGRIARLPVRTAREVPKDKIFDCMEAIHRLRVDAPVHLGDVVLADCAGTGVALVATRSVGLRED